MTNTSPSTAKPRHQLSAVATVWDVAGSLAVIYVLSTVPTPLYEL